MAKLRDAALLLLLAPASAQTTSNAPYKAVAIIRGAGAYGSTISGQVVFEQDTVLGDVTVLSTITGLTDGLHGFHVHQFGDVRETSNLTTIAAHFIPECFIDPIQPGPCENDQKHGLPPNITRQPGDMGNIESLNGALTTASSSLVLGQQKMSLSDPMRSIIGRTVLVHTNEDIGYNISHPYGNAGLPMAYGVIGIMEPATGATNSALAPTVPTVTKVICTFEPPSSITGSALLTLLEPHEPDKVRVQALLTGLTAGSSHSFHFHQWGDLRPSASYGAIYNEAAIAVEHLEVDANGLGIFDYKFTTTSPNIKEALLRHVGRSLTIHDGPTAASSTLAAAVCGLAHPHATLDTGTPPWERGQRASGITGIGVLMILVALFGLAFLVTAYLYHHRKPIPLLGKFIYGPGGPGNYSSPAEKPPPPPPPPEASVAAASAEENQVELRVEKL